MVFEALVEAGNFCDFSWGRIATDVDVQAELNEVADVMARGQLMVKHPEGKAAWKWKYGNNS